MGFAGVPNPMLWKIAVGAVAMAGLAILALIRYFVAGRWLEGIVLFGVFSLGAFASVVYLVVETRGARQSESGAPD